MSHDQVSQWLVEVVRVIESINVQAVAKAAEALATVQGSGGTVFVAGNGGSATTASHFACDLQRWARPDDPRTRAISLSDNVALMTAWGNDVSFEQIFAAQLQVLARPGDALVVISVSGSSPNLLAALAVAREKRLVTVGLLGRDGGRALRLVDYPIVVESEDYGWVESAHLALEHVLTYSLRSKPSQIRGQLPANRP